ncbi:MAG TPA: DUF2459 domain-containing protein, partial [Sphingomicrobium sp.]|nr:DUF2459 domain-containing protein [Sphingomicrobium sp.]
MSRRVQKRKLAKWVGRAVTLLLLAPASYLIAALLGSVIPVNTIWTEPVKGTTIYIADNGLHADLIMPIKAQGLDWSKRLREPTLVPSDEAWVAFGSGERQVYLDTPSWWDLRPRTIARSLVGGERLIHVERVANPYYAARAIRLRPEEYRRLWAAIASDFALDAAGHPERINHRGYSSDDAFYE